MEPNAPLKIQKTEIPTPKGPEVLIRVEAVGVCHSDLHLWEGGYDLGDGTFLKVSDRGVKYPVTPGHEIAGYVEDVGDESGDYSKGDRVLIYPWIGCGKCPACMTDSENLCDTPRSLGVFQDGGYSDHVLVPHHRYLANLKDVDPEIATSLACSALTAYTAIKKAALNSPEYLVLMGAGGLGLMGVQIARIITNSKIVCVDMNDQKLEVAREMGAHYTLNSTGTDIVPKIIEICGGKGADSVVDFVNVQTTAKIGLDVLRKRGNLVLVGLFGGSLNISLVTIPLKAITIQGAYTGTYQSMKELIDLVHKGMLNPRISRRYTLDQVNDALVDLKNHKIVGRAIIKP